MTPEELIKRYNNDYQNLLDLGDFVNDYILEKLVEKLGSRHKTDSFLQIPPVPRVKSIDSLLSKAFYRGHPVVDDPYSAIWDKVGVRYVILLPKNICTIEEIINSSSDWKAQKTRDYRTETENYPDVFNYQSVHYVITCKLRYGDLQCEVQIPTLLQHAYNAVTHDTTYKSLVEPNRRAHRLVARSMALMETTDQIFTETDTLIEASTECFRITLSSCIRLYSGLVDVPVIPDEQASVFLYNSLMKLENQATKDNLVDLLDNHPTIGVQIKKRMDSDFWYRQPIILYAMFVAANHWREIGESWRGLDSDLERILLDVGIGSPD